MNLPYLREEVAKVAAMAAEFIEKSRITSADVETKSKNSLVTYVDKKAEELIISKLAILVPDAGIIAEESDTIQKDGLNWIIDPLDGTTNYIHGVPCYSVSIALVQGIEVLCGCVHEITLNESFTASKDGGAFLNGALIHVSSEAKYANSLIATGFPYYDYDMQENHLDMLRHAMQHTRGIRRLGSAAVDLAYVACGRYEGFFEYSLNAWDVAAGSLLVKEAGGSVLDFSGGTNFLFGSEILATNSGIQAEMTAYVKKYFG